MVDLGFLWRRLHHVICFCERLQHGLLQSAFLSLSGLTTFVVCLLYLQKSLQESPLTGFLVRGPAHQKRFLLRLVMDVAVDGAVGHRYVAKTCHVRNRTLHIMRRLTVGSVLTLIK